MTDKYQTIIAITAAGIQALRVKPAGQRVLVRVALVRKITDAGREGIIKELRRLKKEPGLGLPQGIRLVLPRRELMLRLIIVPPEENKKDFGRFLSGRLSRLVPYSREEVAFAYKLLNVRPGHKRMLLAIFIRRPVLEGYLSIFKKAGITVNAISWSSGNIAAWVKYLPVGEPLNNGLIVLAPSANRVEICFIQRGQLIFSRFVELPFSDSSLNYEALVCEEVRRTIKGLALSGSRGDFNSLMLLGASNKKLQERLEQDLCLQVRTLESYSRLDFSFGEVKAEFINKEWGYFSLLGAVVPEGQTESKLVFVGRQDGFAGSAVTKGLRRLATAWVLFLLLVFGFLFSDLALARKDYASYQAQSLNSERQLKDAKEQMAVYGLLSDENEQKVFVADVIRSLLQAISPEMYLSSLVMRDGSLVLKGHAKDKAAVMAAYERFLAQEIFTRGSLQEVRQSGYLDNKRVEFSVRLFLSAAKESPDVL